MTFVCECHLKFLRPQWLLIDDNLLPHSQIRMEARVGIDRVSSSTSHSKSIVYGIADCLTINELC